jgi:hypothetical protein
MATAFTWNAPLPDNGKSPIEVGDPGHDVMHNQTVDCITEIRTNVDTVQTSAGAPAWDDITGKPAVIAAGADEATARTAIGAGTSSLALGTTATTAMAGNAIRAGRVTMDGDATTPTATVTTTVDMRTGWSIVAAGVMATGAESAGSYNVGNITATSFQIVSSTPADAGDVFWIATPVATP